jgi:glucose-1-phosphate thymidylyltransferase
MKAIVLAAGYATRLQPYTTNFPKPLLKVDGRPLLDFTIESILAAGITDIFVVTNHRFFAHFAAWRDHFCEHRKDANIVVVDDGTSTNEDRLGSIGDLAFTIDQHGIDDDLLVTCADKRFSFDLADFVATFRTTGGAVTTCIDTGSPEIIRKRFGCVRVEDGRIVEFVEKPENPPSGIKSIAFYIYPRAVIGLLPEYLASGENCDAPGNLIRWLIPRLPVHPWFVDDASCSDVGNPASYEAVYQGRKVRISEDQMDELPTLANAPDIALIYLQVADSASEKQAALAPYPTPVNVVLAADVPADAEQQAIWA